MRATTFYDPIDFQPGSPPRILSVPLEEDIAAMQEDIRKARVIADSVVIFMHWGIRMVPKILASYQQPVAHAAIDAGADLIIGHHSHVPKAVEVYRGKVCFYSIGNFMTNLTDWRERFKSPDWNLIWYKVDPDSLYGFPVDCEKLILPRVVFNNEGVKKVGFLTAHMNKLAQPEVLASSDPRFQEFVEYMEWVCDYVPHSFRVEGNEVIIER
ncbi:MAG: CapA family protein [Deltaproteobacteria bacterium]|nr:MAG: CapA family protein [Deltaproteobacteria bacterium]